MYSTAMMRLFGGEVLDIPSQDGNLTSGSDVQGDGTQLRIVISEESGQITAISEDDGIVFQGFTRFVILFFPSAFIANWLKRFTFHFFSRFKTPA
jgi:hypothetical protein